MHQKLKMQHHARPPPFLHFSVPVPSLRTVPNNTYTRTAGTNKLSSITGTFGVRSILYDARGNTQSESRSGGIAVTTAYDGHGRLISYARTGDVSQTNGYNGMDERVVVTSGTVTRRFVYDPDGRVVGEYGTSATNVIAERIWLNPETNDAGMFGGDDGTGGYAPIAVVIGSTLRWVHANHMGVPQLHTSNTGAIIATPAYTLPGFPGQFRTYADLYYNKYRDYDTTTGRYIQADPIGLAGDDNPYLYAVANPLRYMDPSGEFTAGFFGPGGYKNRKRILKKKDDCPPPPPIDWCGSKGSEWVPDGNWGAACRNHDACYGTSGASKLRCDGQLALEIAAECTENTYGVGLPVCGIVGFLYGGGLATDGLLNPWSPSADAYMGGQKR